MASIVQFVSAISTSPTVRLDLNSTSSNLMVDEKGIDLSPPVLRYAVASTMLQDGETIAGSSYENRVLKLPLKIVYAASTDAAATALQNLGRELNRPTNIIKLQLDGATSPVFFRTFRSSYALSMLRLLLTENTTITLELPTEPFGLGLLETPVSGVTVSTDPAATNNGCFVDVDFATPSNANPYFETDVTNWTAINGPTLSRSTAQFHEGVASMLITPNGVSADPRAQSETLVVTAGQSWFASGWLRSPGTPSVGIHIRWYSDAAGSTFISESGNLATLAADTWTYFSVTGVAPATAIRARIAARYSGTPAAGTTLFVDEAVLGPSQGIKGDVEAPSLIRLPSAISAAGRISVLATRRRGNPSGAPFLFQAEAMTQGTDTTTQANDANFSGSGNNYSRCTFTTATMQTRLSTLDIGTPGVDLRGRYRVFLRYRKNSPTTDPVNLRLRWGDADGGNVVINDAYATMNVGLIVTADLGEISIPIGFDPVTGSDGVVLPVSDAFKIELQAERVSGTTTIDFDFLLLIPADDRLAFVAWEFTGADHWRLDAGDTSAHVRDASDRVTSARSPAIAGGFPMLTPNQTNRIYLLRQVSPLSSYTLTTVSPVSVSYHPRYLTVRPAST